MSGPIALLDTNIFLSARNPGETAHGACRRLLDAIDAGQLQAMVSTLTIAEIRAGLTPAEAAVMWQSFVSHLVSSPNYSVESVDLEIAELAGAMRPRTGLSLPDALIVATGHLRGAAYLVTQDRTFARAQELLPVRLPERAP